MTNIKLLRIDERLIHGQIVTSWIASSAANTILIADDNVAGDELQCDLLAMATPPGIQLKITGLKQAIEFIRDSNENRTILLLVKTPDVVAELITLGLNIDKINVGNMGSRKNRVKYATTLWLTHEETQLFKQLMAMGKEIFLQVLPSDNPQNLSQLLK